MDDRSFDRLVRLLGGATDRRASLKALAGGILGAGGLAALDADADAKRKGRDHKDAGPDAGKKRRRTCKPACEAGFTCEKVGRKRACVCRTGVVCGEACCALGQGCVEGQCRAAACAPPCADGYVCEGMACVCPSGVECGEACCAAGQTCQDGACAGQPDPDRCIPAGEPCKNVGRACCGGRVCASGQGGEPDIACYVPKTGRCAGTADCVYGTVCTDGRCTPPPAPPPTPVGQLGAACNPATDVCTSPGATCRVYTGAGAPSAEYTYCLLPLQTVCTAGPQCACYSCGYPTEAVPGAVQAGRRGRATVLTTCCGQPGESCGSDRDCCEGTTCSGGACVANACTVCQGGGCAYSTIAEAISGGATDIRIAGGTYEEHSLPLPTGNALTLRPCSASPVTIDAKQLGRIMQRIPNNTTITIIGITMRNAINKSNGQTDDDGGAFWGDDFSTLKLERVTIADSHAGDGNNWGGAVHSFGKVEIRDSLISGCSAEVGGGISIRSGTSSLTVSGSTFTDCSTTSGTSGGGAIAVSNGTLTMSGSTVTKCRTNRNGGGLYFARSLTSSSAKVTDSTFSTNVADSEGGAIYVENGGLEMARTTVVGNRALGATATSTEPCGGGVSLFFNSGNGQHFSGNLAPAASLVDCTIDGNYAQHRGGGLSVRQSAVNPQAGAVSITGGSISKNEAAPKASSGAVGGGAHFKCDATTAVSVNGVRLASNTLSGAQTGGGGVYVERGAVSITGVTVIEKNVTTASGGGIYVEQGQLNLRGSAEVRDNTAATGAGIFASAGAAGVACQDTPKVCSNPTSSPFSNCGGTAGKYGSACTTNDTICKVGAC